MMKHIARPDIRLLPNTSGVRDAEEAVFAAQMAREAFGTDFIKLEIHPDPRYLLPDPVETLLATERLAKMGFIVLPYIQADPVLCKRLEEAGTAAVMPLAAPIGSNKGLVTRELLKIIIEQSLCPRCGRRRAGSTLTCRRGDGTRCRRRIGQHGYRRSGRPRAHGKRLRRCHRRRPRGVRGRTWRRVRLCRSLLAADLLPQLNKQICRDAPRCIRIYQ